MLTEKCFQDGFKRGVAVFVKSALSPRAVLPTAMAPLRATALRGLGEDIFNNAHNPKAGLLDSLKNIAFSGFDQLRHATQLRDDHLLDVKGLGAQAKAMYKRGPTGAIINKSDPGIQMVLDRIRQNSQHFRRQRNTAMTQLGANAEPRIKALRTGVPLAAGVIGGGAAAGTASGIMGAREGRNDMANSMANMPLLQRFKQLIAPQTTALQLLNNK